VVKRAGSCQEVKRRLIGETGVDAVTLASLLPGMDHLRGPIEVAGVTATAREVSAASVDVDFFDAFGAPILSGRGFNSGDFESNRRVVIVNQSFAHQVLEDRNPVGRRVREPVSPGREPGP
jgi:hypothetical protein